MGKHTRIELESWNRFHTSNLAVAPDLVGRSHVFRFDGRAVSITLPNYDKPPEYDPDSPVGRRGFDPDSFPPPRLAISGWGPAPDGKMRPLEVHVLDVDVVVDIPGRASVPEAARLVPPKRPELFSEHQRNRLNKLVDEYGDLASRAFDLWIRTVRWKVDAYRIGLPETSDAETGWRTYLRERHTQKDLWASGMILTVYMAKAVTVEQWDEISAALNADEQPPIFWDLLYDAMGHLERGDLQRTIVDTAVAAETYLRTSVQQHFPDDLNESLQAHINEANIHQVLSKFFPELLDDEQRRVYKPLKSDLSKLFSDRNRIMHSGHKEGLTEQYCRKLTNRVGSLLKLVPPKID